MIFELGKTYIVDVTEKGIVPLMEFDKSKWYDKDHDDLDFLTDEEKVIVINTVLDKIRDEINTMPCAITSMREIYVNRDKVVNILDKYKAESEDEE